MKAGKDVGPDSKDKTLSATVDLRLHASGGGGGEEGGIKHFK